MDRRRRKSRRENNMKENESGKEKIANDREKRR